MSSLNPKVTTSTDPESILDLLEASPRNEGGARVLKTGRVPAVMVLRALLKEGLKGELSIDGGRGWLGFAKGRVLAARFDGLTGVSALVRLLALGRGEYLIDLKPMSIPATLHFGLAELEQVVLPRLAKWSKLLPRSVPLDSHLVVSFQDLAASLPTLPDGVNQVVKLFDGMRDVRQVLLDSPLDETVTLEIVDRLYLLGVLKADRPHPLLSKTVKLFEPKSMEAEERLHELFSDDVPALDFSAALSSDDWFKPARETGLEMEQPTGGWTTEPLAEVEAHLRAFAPKTVVEPLERQVAPIELRQFSAGVEVNEPPAMEAALISVPALRLTQEMMAVDPSVEDQFFSDAPAPELSVSEAVLGWSAPVAPEAEKEASLRWPAVVAVVALLIGGVALTALAFSENSTATPPVAMAKAVVPPAVPEIPAALPAPMPVDDNRAERSAIALNDATAAYEAGKVTQAREMLEALVADDPSLPQAWLLLGTARFDTKDPDGAQEAALTALALEPKTADAYMLMASVQGARKQKAEANASLEQYLKLAPEGQYAEEARALLKR